MAPGVTNSPLYSGSVEVLERLRRGHLLLGEPGVVDVDAHVAEVDRGQLVGAALELEVRGGRRQRLRGVRRQHVLLDRPRREGVVDAVDAVGQRGVLGQHQLVGELPGVALRLHLDGDAGLLLEVGQHVLRHGPRVVGGHDEGLRVAVGPVGATSGARVSATTERAPRTGEARNEDVTNASAKSPSTSFAGANRSRFKGLRLSALSAPLRRSPVGRAQASRPGSATRTDRRGYRPRTCPRRGGATSRGAAHEWYGAPGGTPGEPGTNPPTQPGQGGQHRASQASGQPGQYPRPTNRPGRPVRRQPTRPVPTASPASRVSTRRPVAGSTRRRRELLRAHPRAHPRAPGPTASHLPDPRPAAQATTTRCCGSSSGSSPRSRLLR